MTLLSSLDFLEFCDPNNPQTVTHTHSVKPKTAMSLCVVPPSTIFFADFLKRYVHRLDCSGSMPTICQSIAYDCEIIDICYAKHSHENLLIVAGDERLQAFQADTGQIKWSNKDVHLSGLNEEMKPFRIAADGNGRLFVNDENNKCIEMFSASDGQYLGCLIKEGEQGLGDLWGMCCAEATSQLVVSHRKYSSAFIAILNVE